jgi:LruC domain-containing protein
MKKLIAIIFTIFILAVFAGCPSPYDSSGSGGLYDKNSLPADLKYDALRSSSSEFTFETLFPVRVKLDVALYSLDTEGNLLSDPLPPDSAEINISLIDKRGAVIYSGKVSSAGSLLTTVYLPSAPENVILKLQAAGFEDRQVVINNMVRYREINRTMAMKKYASGSRSAQRSLPFSNPYPDPVLNVPEITIAFEDLFGNARAGDADYNDFIASYKITETMNQESGLVSKIDVEATAVRKWAGYDHRFGIRIDSFEGSAAITGTYINSSGISVPFSASRSNEPIEIVLFERSSKAVGKTASFTIEFQTLQFTDPEQSGGSGSVLLSRPPYNPYIYVHNTKKDIHLIDRQPLKYSQNPDPDDRFVDSEGFPWALLVPSAWESPAEGQRIEEAYPRFENWRLSSGDLHGDWYNYPGEPYVEDPDPVTPAKMVFSSNRDGDFEIYSIDPETGTTAKLTDNTSTDKHPALSADGKKIAFVSNRSGSWAIYTMNSDGTGVSSPVAALSGAYDGHPSWNPDASKIAYDNAGDIFIINADGSGNSNITNTASFPKEIEPDWSPDGIRILYSSNKDFDYDIYVMNSDGTSPVRLTSNNTEDQKPSWSHDGNEIAFSTNRDGNYDIYVMNSDGTSPVNFTNNPDMDNYPSWSSDGNSIAYVRSGAIYTVDSNSPSSGTLLILDAVEPSW